MKNPFTKTEAPTLHQQDLTGMLSAMGATGKHVYGGSVPDHVKARRRAANKRARIARRAGRR